MTIKTFRCSFSLRSEKTEQEQTLRRLKRVETEHSLNPTVPRGVPGVGPGCGDSPGPAVPRACPLSPFPASAAGAAIPTQRGSTAVSAPPARPLPRLSLRTHHRGAKVPAAPQSPSRTLQSRPGPPNPPGPAITGPGSARRAVPSRAAPPRFQISPANAHWPSPQHRLPLASPAAGDWQRRNTTARCLLVAR